MIIIHSGDRLFMEINRPHPFFLLPDIGNNVTAFRGNQDIECIKMFGIFREDPDTTLIQKLDYAMKFMTKGSELSYLILCIGPLDTASASELMIQKYHYYILIDTGEEVIADQLILVLCYIFIHM